MVILDVMLPGLDGFEVCRQLRAFSDAYVLMLTARGEEVDRVVGLTIGADDDLVKPFSPRELVARIKALPRRPRGPATQPPAAPEFDLLAVLARDAGIVVRRSSLLERLWGSEFVADDHLVDVHIANLRRKLGDDPANPRFIETVRGVGYRLRED